MLEWPSFAFKTASSKISWTLLIVSCPLMQKSHVLPTPSSSMCDFRASMLISWSSAATILAFTYCAFFGPAKFYFDSAASSDLSVKSVYGIGSNGVSVPWLFRSSSYLSGITCRYPNFFWRTFLFKTKVDFSFELFFDVWKRYKWVYLLKLAFLWTFSQILQF